MLRKKNINRRQFLKTAAALSSVISFPLYIPSRTLGMAGSTAPNERITSGFIGVGNMGTSHLRSFLKRPNAQVIAVCDVNANKRRNARYFFYEHYRRKDCAVYNDFRELLSRDDIDAVVIATPDHWHAVCAIKAAEAGKDIYCEKPLSLTVAQAQAMVQAARRHQRIFQTGSQQRSNYFFRHGCELIRNGYIGDIKSIVVGIGGHAGPCYLPAQDTPNYIDWDLWLGPAPKRPYNNLIENRWRSYWDYSGGELTDWGAHHFDIAQWALGMDNSGPVEIYPPNEKREVTYKYANGVTLTRKQPEKWEDFTVLVTGSEGEIEIHREFLRTKPEKLARQKIKNNEIRLYRSKDHRYNFLDCIRSRQRPAADVEIGYRSVTICHLGNIAYRLNRELKWDPVNVRFVNDPQADRFLARSMRSPWHL